MTSVFHPYLNFGENCREAFTRYHEILGGELEVMTMADVPGDDIPADRAHLVMHAALSLPGGGLLMASDTGDPDFGPVQGIYVSLSVPDPAEAERVFTALADGGEIEMPLETTFWSPMFGVCRDRFGTPWMVGADPVDDPAPGSAA